MSEPLSTSRIIGVGLLLFSSILLGVGIHHIVATGTCSSTGYSANFGPVQHCPAGTGDWFAFVFGGIIGGLVGGIMAGGLGAIFAGIFGAIGIGALTLGFDHHVASSTKTFGIAFGAPFTIVGLVAGGYALWSAFDDLRSSARAGAAPASKTRHPAHASPTVATNAITPPRTTVAQPFVSAFSPPAAPAAASTTSLTQLAELHRQGALTDAEFAAAKARVLGGVSA